MAVSESMASTKTSDLRKRKKVDGDESSEINGNKKAKADEDEEGETEEVEAKKITTFSVTEFRDDLRTAEGLKSKFIKFKA